MGDREAFIAERRDRWRRLDGLLLASRLLTPAEWSDLASLYRSVCNDLARATDLDLGEDLRAHLDDLAARAHGALYGARPSGGLRLIRLLAVEVPREIRAHGGTFALANLLFYGPWLIGCVGALVSLDFATGVLPSSMLQSMEEMYADPTLTRGDGDDASMAGFYVLNNVGIALRCFTTGALAGLGPVFFLVYNGLTLGTVTGYLFAVGRGGNLLAFIAGHSPWELTGVVIAGTAGLRLGWALIETGGLTRAASVRLAAPALYRLVSGAVFVLLVAAAIEGFFSASPLPAVVKWAFGVLQVAIVGAWIGFGGRRA
jgi:uncharacterized membrane protein SpoIIM required for sporulation